MITFLSQELTETKYELTHKVTSQSQELTQTKQELVLKATFEDQIMEAKLNRPSTDSRCSNNMTCKS